MNIYKKITSLALGLLLGLGLSSCSEEVDHARLHRSENEQAFLSYKAKEGYERVSLPGLYGDSYVYVKWTKRGQDKIKPKQTDKVRLRRRSYLLTEWNESERSGLFYSNYTEEKPKAQEVMSEVEGIQIALQNMVVGDVVTVAVPWYLGLGADPQIKDGTQIQGYTSLLYQIELLGIGE